MLLPHFFERDTSASGLALRTGNQDEAMEDRAATRPCEFDVAGRGQSNARIDGARTARDGGRRARGRALRAAAPRDRARAHAKVGLRRARRRSDPRSEAYP